MRKGMRDVNSLPLDGDTLPELTRESVVPLVIDALVEALGENDNSLLGLTHETRLGADLDLVSLQLVQFSVALEDRFPGNLDPTWLLDVGDAPADATVGDVAARIVAMLAAADRPGGGA